MLALLDMEFQEPQRSSYNPSSGITAHATMLSFYRGLGIELGSLGFHVASTSLTELLPKNTVCKDTCGHMYRCMYMHLRCTSVWDPEVDGYLL